jgi:hypothetical protein
MPQLTLWVHMDNFMCPNGSKVVSKFEKHDRSRLLHPPDSPGISPRDFWLFGMLKGILKHRGGKSNDEINQAIPSAWNDLIFDEVQSVFR